ncbi:MAG: DNA recombination protein RmuC [Clostridia bacterium]|nr:DNA recombination protein RmuC [Clostridia bacterium]
MQTALLVISALLSALSLALVCLLLVKTKRTGGGSDAETLRRLEEKTDAIGKLTDFNTRTTENLSRSTEARLNNIQARLAEDMKYIVDSNMQNLERIRRTVDDKLTSSIDGKLTESYARISERLEKMYESVGEMRSLSHNVSDIHRIFTNVKLRGSWGEAQLETLLEQMLAPEQYEKSVKLNPLESSLVDFAIRLPAKNGDTVLLPVDSKFPVEEFERLCDCSERGDREGADRAAKNLERAVKTQADSIAKKYIRPPFTTDFAVMYLPSEGLYAEVVKAEGLSDFLRSRRMIACGPTNFCALLSTLQTGFRTAAIERRSGELRQMLEIFRADFLKFAELLEKTKKKLQEATDTVESAEKRTGTIGRKLATFQGFSALPEDADGE